MKSITKRPGLWTSKADLSKLMLAFACVWISVMTGAQTKTEWFSNSQNRAIVLDQAFQQAEVRGQVTVILTNAPGTDLVLNGHAKDISSVRTTVKNGRLLIDAENKKTFEKLRVYLPASSLSSLIINGDAEVLSAGRVKASNLRIILNGTSLLAMDYEGQLKIIPGDGYELVDRRGYKN